MTHPFVSPLYRPGLNGPKSTAHEYLSFPLLLCLPDELVATALDDMMARLHGALLVSTPFAGQLTGNTPNGIRAAIRRGKLDVLRVDDRTRGVTWASVTDYFGISPALPDQMEISWRAAAGCPEGPLFMSGPQVQTWTSDYGDRGDGLKPESTEGRPWGQPLKKPAGAPLNLG